VSHHGLAIYIKKYLRVKNNYENSIFHHAKILSSKKSSKETKIL
jgi:hypothetical protein